MPVGVYPRSQKQLEILRKHQFKPGHNAVAPRLRFWQKVEVQGNGCWLWKGYTNNKGYAKFSVNGKPQYAHRFAYEQLIGPIPTGRIIDHLCRNRKCVNPAHMEPVTYRENFIRGKGAQKIDSCRRGHPWTPENTYMREEGRRECRACHRLIEREAYRRRHGQNS